MKRPFAPAADRLKSLIARERLMPAALAEARKNLSAPPKIYTQIAIEQIDGNISFFKNDVTAAFAEVTDTALTHQFKQANDSVITALARATRVASSPICCPRQARSIRLRRGQVYRKALAANEMVELPLDELPNAHRRSRSCTKNEAAFQQPRRKQIDSTKPADGSARERYQASIIPRPTS